MPEPPNLAAYVSAMDEHLQILVVDDDEVDRMTLRRALRQANITADLQEAEDYATARLALSETRYDCIFVDYRLPDKNGMALVQDLRAAGIETPLVILTGQGDDQTAVELMKAGASDYLSKDRLSAKTLAQILHNVIRLYRAEVDAALANQRLRESEERYRFVLEGANDGIWDWDIDRDQVYFNERLFRIVGLSRDDMRESDAGGCFSFEEFCELVCPEDRDRFKETINTHLKRRKPFDIELQLQRRPQYVRRYCIVRAKAQRTPTGRPVRMAGVVIDITERKRAEERLAQQNDLLRRTIEERDQIASQREDFVSRLTHDLRTPLVAADRMLALIKSGTFGQISDALHQAVEVMITSNQNLLSMVNTLLEVYRYEAGRKSFTFSPFNFSALLREVVKELTSLAGEKQLPLVLEGVAQAGASEELDKVMVRGDRLEVRRVVTNLIGNAIKFTDQGQVTVYLRTDRPNWITLQVKDTGSGIAQEDQELIFDRFRQSKDRRGGSGLGLYLSRRIIEEHGGTIAVTSALTEGSCFTIMLPSNL
ncbi:MAG: ATP-binding protein [Cyanobacteria bacterium P01_A01_bin.135]